MSYFLLKSNCFTLTSLLFYFKGLCENFISYTIILLNFERKVWESFDIMVINNRRALLLITYKNLITKSYKSFICNKIAHFSEFSNFHHKEKPLKKNQQSTLPASNRWRQWSQAATLIPAINISALQPARFMISFMEF